MARSIMIQGTSSHVGKSILVAALCRIFRDSGIDVAPFKAQNMALNSFVTEDGREMGRSQAVQAEAAGLKPDSDMNPILLKPNSDTCSQLIIQGKVHGNLSAAEYHRFKEEAMEYVEESYRRLAARHGLVVIEGAGSPAEINLRENDIANMGTAHMAKAPVILVGDIDRGGVFASLVGTMELLDERDRNRVNGFIINKFRGDISILRPGIEYLEERTGLPVIGIVPYFSGIYIQDEDSMSLGDKNRRKDANDKEVNIAVIRLPHISNFTDFDPLSLEEGVDLRYVMHGESIGSADVIIIPGTKNTLADLAYLRDMGYTEEIETHVRNGGTLIGICGGYQMLGKKISDPYGVERGGYAEGLGYLDVETVMDKAKSTHQIEAAMTARGVFAYSGTLSGYEIHMGKTSLGSKTAPLFTVTSRDGNKTRADDGASSRNGMVWGTYIHGIFDDGPFRRAFIERIKGESRKTRRIPAAGAIDHNGIKEEGYRRLAQLVMESLDMDAIYRIAGMERRHIHLRNPVEGVIVN